MTIQRRQFLHLAAGAVAVPAMSNCAWGQAYPSRPVHWIVPFPPGGGTDILSRLIGQWLSERLGQQFVIDNRPGAGSNIGTEAAVHASPDGYTLLLAASVHTINPSLYDKLGFNFIRDIAPVVGLMRVPNVMVLHPSIPARSVPEFIAYARANPGKINVASAGIGTAQHLAAELFKLMAGVDMVHVPYRGTAPALTDLLGGQVQLLFMSPASSLQYIRAGTLRGLAVTSAVRSQALPDLPPVGDFLPGFEASLMYGLGVPRNTPPEIVDRLNKEVNAGLADSGIKARLADLDGTVLGGSPADFGKLIAEETEKWRKVIRLANIKPE
ncbi:Bug family tripartite tricarboxylate transporter substrate binding protein [Rhodoplanes sp. Z2-YC6860]|uniref:Bug family tripartite tricarboxylate transporter substrate binding protein n=1 Tax=Rhodoplanes sp. Z2-YC6860 TaxID=674703 RepID=UPI00078BF74A|nr:tripartite tricarboxylate transporter substrate binding protein [Rhodoplanes sp. Z2-YC6860]AMN42802.1 DHA2 family major facilitator superfamily protein [Rhodoplanes sp. Z2-YC6860]